MNKIEREAQWIEARLRGIDEEVNQQEYNLDIKPYITSAAGIFSDATTQDVTSVDAVKTIIDEMEKHYDVEVKRIDDVLEIWKKGYLVDHFPLDKKLSERDIQKRNMEGSFVYGRPGSDIFSIIPPHLQP